MIFEELHNNIQLVIDNLDNIMIEAMVENKESIIDLNVSQILEGKKGDGNKIEPEYALKDYADLKKSMGSKAPLGTPDLNLEGNFTEGFYNEGYTGSNFESSGLFIDSHDSKADKLFSKYSGIIGIAPENHEEFAELIIDNVQNKIIDGITRI
jgi:hypothetical protein